MSWLVLFILEVGSGGCREWWLSGVVAESSSLTHFHLKYPMAAIVYHLLFFVFNVAI